MTMGLAPLRIRLCGGSASLGSPFWVTWDWVHPMGDWWTGGEKSGIFALYFPLVSFPHMVVAASPSFWVPVFPERWPSCLGLYDWLVSCCALNAGAPASLISSSFLIVADMFCPLVGAPTQVSHLTEHSSYGSFSQLHGDVVDPVSSYSPDTSSDGSQTPPSPHAHQQVSFCLHKALPSQGPLQFALSPPLPGIPPAKSPSCLLSS